MLIILSGAETIHRKFFAKRIISALNTFTIDGYTVKFVGETFIVTDPSGKVVYSPTIGDVPGTNELLIDLNNDGIKDEIGFQIFEKAVALNGAVLLEGVRDNHFANIFVDIPYDFGQSDRLEYSFPDSGYIQPHNYEDVLNNYRNRPCENFVISGSFSKAFIDNVRADIGEENVKVINITRHPSVAFLTHWKPEAYYIKNTEFTEEFEENKLLHSIANTVSLSRFDDIMTIKFEDIIQNGHFMFEGVRIDVPDNYINYNGFMTVWEKEYVETNQLATADELAEFNHNFSHVASLNGFDSRVPEDFFAHLGYDQLTFEQIMAQ